MLIALNASAVGSRRRLLVRSPQASGDRTHHRRYWAAAGDRLVQLFTSMRVRDQAPATPELLLARTRNHMVFVGSVLVLNFETAWFG